MSRIVLPLLVIALTPGLALAQPPESKEVQTVDVELTSFSFMPSDLVFEHGKSYRLRLHNASSGGHDFAASEFFAASRIEPEDQGKLEKGRVDLHGGDTAEITLVPLKAGTYPLRCSHFMHGGFGMKGSITVK